MITQPQPTEQEIKIAKGELARLLGLRQGVLLWDDEIVMARRYARIAGIKLTIHRTDFVNRRTIDLDTGEIVRQY